MARRLSEEPYGEEGSAPCGFQFLLDHPIILVNKRTLCLGYEHTLFFAGANTGLPSSSMCISVSLSADAGIVATDSDKEAIGASRSSSSSSEQISLRLSLVKGTA